MHLRGGRVRAQQLPLDTWFQYTETARYAVAEALPTSKRVQDERLEMAFSATQVTRVIV